jgi:hypothetical protein
VIEVDGFAAATRHVFGVLFWRVCLCGWVSCLPLLSRVSTANHPMNLLFLITSLLPYGVRVTHGESTVVQVVPSSSSNITYSGFWKESGALGSEYTFALSLDPSAQATFMFTGLCAHFSKFYGF